MYDFLSVTDVVQQFVLFLLDLLLQVCVEEKEPRYWSNQKQPFRFPVRFHIGAHFSENFV